MADRFTIQCDTIIDPKQAQQQLKNSKLKMDVAVNIDTSSLQNNFSKVNKVFQLTNVKTSILSKYVNSAGKEFQNVTKRVETFSNGLGETRTRVTYLSDSMQVLGSKVTKATQNLKPFKKELESVEKTITKMPVTITSNGQAMQGTITQTVETMRAMDGSVQQVTTRVTEYTDSLGRTIKTTQRFDANNRQIGTTLREVQQDLTNTNRATQTLGSSFAKAIKQLANYYLASLPIRMVQKAISDSITVIKEFDKAMTEFNKVSTYSEEQLKSYAKTLTRYGEEVGRTTTEMVQSATEFKKAGFTEEDSAILAKVASLYQNTADEELSASEATSVLVSQMKAFNITAQDSIHITDAINQVSQDFAVSSGDIGKGLTQAGASLSTYGNSFEQTIGLTN